MTAVPQNFAPTIDRLRHSLGSQILSQGLKLVVSIGIGGWTARYLGPALLGKLSYVIALVGILGPIGGLGARGSLAALLCEPQPPPGLVSSAFCVELLGTAGLAIALIPWMWAAGDPVIPWLIGFMVLANLFNSSEVFEAQLLNLQRGTLIARVDLIQTSAGAFLSIGALLLKAPLLVFGALYAIQSAIRYGLLFRLVRIASLRFFFAQARWELVKRLIRRGWPLLLSGLSIMIYMKSDQVMLQWMMGPDAVGQYSVAIRVVEAPYFLPVILANTFMVRLGDQDSAAAQIALKQLYRLAWVLGLGMALLSALIFPVLVLVVFGDQYHLSQNILIWLAPSAFAVATGCASGAWLNVSGYVKIIAKRSFVGALLNIVLNLVLIPVAGLAGAAVATSISYLVSVYLVGLLDSRVRQNTLFLLAPL